MWELDHKEGERWRIAAFELQCWRRLLRVPWTARRSNKSILKEISPGCSLEELMLKLKLQYFGHLMRRTDSLEKTLMLGKIEGKRRRGRAGWHHWLDGCESEWTPGVGDGQGGLVCCSSRGHKESDITEWLNWTTLPQDLAIELAMWNINFYLLYTCVGRHMAVVYPNGTKSSSNCLVFPESRLINSALRTI